MIGRRAIVYLGTPVVILAVLAAAFELVPLEYFSEAELTDRIRSWGHWGVVGSIALMVAHSIVPFPAEILALANGMVYGPTIGFLVTWVGAMLGAMFSFWLARIFGRPVAQKLIPSSRWGMIDALSQRSGATATLLLLRLVPIIAFNAINFAAGLAKVRFWTFCWTTGIGITPLAALTSIAGAELFRADWWLWVLAVSGAIAGWIGWRIVKHRRGHGEKS